MCFSQQLQAWSNGLIMHVQNCEGHTILEHNSSSFHGDNGTSNFLLELRIFFLNIIVGWKGHKPHPFYYICNMLCQVNWTQPLFLDNNHSKTLFDIHYMNTVCICVLLINQTQNWLFIYCCSYIVYIFWNLGQVCILQMTPEHFM